MIVKYDNGYYLTNNSDMVLNFDSLFKSSISKYKTLVYDFIKNINKDSIYSIIASEIDDNKYGYMQLI